MNREAAKHGKRPGPPATGKGTLVGLRLQPPMLSSLDAWIAVQPDPSSSRPEAVRRLLEAALSDQTMPRTLNEQIARQERRIASNPAADEPSPADGMATLRRGLAETTLRALKSTKHKLRKGPR